MGDGEPCCISAEIGQNHNGEDGGDQEAYRHGGPVRRPAVKFQKRDVESELSVELRRQALRERELVRQPPTANTGSSWNYRGNSTRELQQYATEKGVLYLCTICDLVSVEQMAPLEVPAYRSPPAT